MNVTTIVLIPGLWVTALVWENWVRHYAAKGYGVIPSNWPGMDGEIDELRRDPSRFASLGLTKLVDHYEQFIRRLDTPPLIIGHGLGGLITQTLLDRGWGATGVAIASVPPKGVYRSLLGNLKLALRGRALTPKRFHREFANTLDEVASLSAFKRYVVPAPNDILREVVLAHFSPDGASSVRFYNDSRASLLLVSGGKDRLVLPSIVKANFDSYRESKAETDYKEYPNQSHFTLTQETKIADYVLGWALCRADGSKLTAVSNQIDTWSVQLAT